MNRKSFVNICSLFLIQGSNALFPLFVFPYLFIIFDSEVFSQLVVLESVMLYVLAFSLYSFDVTGVKDIGLAKGDLRQKIAIFYDILLIRLFFLAVLSIAFLFGLFMFFNEQLLAGVFWLLFPLGMILQSNYYHQAIEKNSMFAIVVFCWRLGATISAIVICKRNEDFTLLVAILGLNYFGSGAMSFILVAKNHKFSHYNFCLSRLASRLTDGVGIYLGNLSVALFRGSNILLLSMVSTPAAVAVYALAEKFIKTTQALVRPLNQFAYPRVVNDMKNKNDFSNIFRIILKRTTPQVGILFVSILLLLFVSLILKEYSYFTNELEESVVLFFIMSLATVFGVCNYMFGTVGMSLLNLGAYYAKTIFSVGLISVCLTLIMGYFFQEFGAALAYSLAEILLLLCFLTKYSKIRANV